MTRQEAAGVVRVLRYADGGCSSCIRHLLKALIGAMPDEPWLELARESDDGDTRKAVEKIDKEAKREAQLAAEAKERETFIPEWARK